MILVGISLSPIIGIAVTTEYFNGNLNATVTSPTVGTDFEYKIHALSPQEINIGYACDFTFEITLMNKGQGDGNGPVLGINVTEIIIRIFVGSNYVEKIFNPELNYMIENTNVVHKWEPQYSTLDFEISGDARLELFFKIDVVYDDEDNTLHRLITGYEDRGVVINAANGDETNGDETNGNEESSVPGFTLNVLVGTMVIAVVFLTSRKYKKMNHS